MNREIKLLYDIFEYELKPFKDTLNPSDESYFIYDQWSNLVGEYKLLDETTKLVKIYREKSNSLISKIEQMFGTEISTTADAKLIANHLLIWFQDNFPRGVTHVWLYNKIELITSRPLQFLIQRND